jgi:hypothetical protein
MRRQLLSALLLVLYLFSATEAPFSTLVSASSGVSTIIDASDDCSVAWLDILDTQLMQITSDRIQFDASLNAPPPAAPDEWTSYYWCLDTDFNADTGVKYWMLGAEYILLLTYNEGVWSASGWKTTQDSYSESLPFFIDGNVVSVSVSRNQITADKFKWLMVTSNPATYDWATFADFEFSVGWAETTFPKIVPTSIVLSSGKIEETILVNSTANGGQESIKFFSDLPGLLDEQRRGVVKAKPGVIGNYKVMIKEGEVISENWVDIQVGSAYLTPPILLLSVIGNRTGSITAKVYDAYGSEMVVRNVNYFASNPFDYPLCANIDESGLVAAIQATTEEKMVTYMSATVDGLSSLNQVPVQVKMTDLGITYQEVRSEHTSFSFPEQTIAGVNYEEAYEEFGMVELVEKAYMFLTDLFGFAPYNGGTQYYVFEPHYYTENNEASARSGNTIRMYVNIDKSNYISANWQTAVLIHELSHNFSFDKYPGNFFSNKLSHKEAYQEWFADTLAHYICSTFMQQADKYGISAKQLSVLDWLQTQYTGEDLKVYIGLGASYQKITQRVLCDITHLIYTEYGHANMAGLFTLFRPDRKSDSFTFASDAEQATFFAAAVGCSVGEDLRQRFRGWGFPIDDEYYLKIIDDVRSDVASSWTVARIDERTPLTLSLMGSKAYYKPLITIEGMLSPATSGVPLLIEYFNEDWVVLSSVVTDYYGSFRYHWVDPPLPIGLVRVRVSLGNRDTLFSVKAITSNYTISKIPSTLHIKRVPSQIELGETINISGTFSPEIPGQAVSVVYSCQGADAVTHELLTGSNGRFNDTFTPIKSGEWTIIAMVGSDYYDTASTEIKFTVTASVPLPLLSALTGIVLSLLLSMLKRRIHDKSNLGITKLKTLIAPDTWLDPNSSLSVCESDADMYAHS